MFISSSLKILILPWQYDLGHSHSFYPLVSTTKELNVGKKKRAKCVGNCFKKIYSIQLLHCRCHSAILSFISLPFLEFSPPSTLRGSLYFYGNVQFSVFSYFCFILTGTLQSRWAHIILPIFTLKPHTWNI